MEPVYPRGTNGVNRLRDYAIDGSQVAPSYRGMPTIADRTNELIKRLDGRSLRSFEDEHGIPNGTIGKLARGDRKEPAAATVQKVALAFGVTQAWLMGQDEPAAKAPERTYEPTSRYPSREQAIALLRGVVADQVLESLRFSKTNLEAESDPGLEFWVTEAKRLNKLREDLAKEVRVEVPERRR